MAKCGNSRSPGKSSVTVLAAAHDEDHLLLDVAHLCPLGYPPVIARVGRSHILQPPHSASKGLRAVIDQTK